MTISGSCLCGAVRYEITGAPAFAGHCHCSICRKAHGAAFATWAIVEPERFQWTAGAGLVQEYESSPDRKRCFCRTCGTPLAASHGGRISEVVLATIDGDPLVRPREHIFVASQARWYEIADDLPQFPEWPPGIGP
jgi:hypothetical protein